MKNIAIKSLKNISLVIKLFILAFLIVCAIIIIYNRYVKPHFVCNGDYLLRVDNEIQREKHIKMCLKKDCWLAQHYYMYWSGRKFKNIPNELDKELTKCIKENGGESYIIFDNKVIHYDLLRQQNETK